MEEDCVGYGVFLNAGEWGWGFLREERHSQDAARGMSCLGCHHWTLTTRLLKPLIPAHPLSGYTPWFHYHPQKVTSTWPSAPLFHSLKIQLWFIHLPTYLGNYLIQSPLSLILQYTLVSMASTLSWNHGPKSH